MVDGERINSTSRPLLLGIGGIGTKIAVRAHDPDLFDTILLDTDRRSDPSSPDLIFRQVGDRLVGGEGSGSNMNTARACFRMDMEGLVPLITGRRLVIILSSSEGATGLAGSVEVNSFFIKIGMPSLVFLISPAEDTPRPTAGRIWEILIDGPLRPGCRVEIPINFDKGGEQDDPTMTEMFIDDLRSLMAVSSSFDGMNIPQAAWTDIRNDGGPFEISSVDIEFDRREEGEKDLRIEPRSPAIVAVEVPRNISNDRVRKLIDTLFGPSEGISFGIRSMKMEKDHARAVILQKCGDREGDKRHEDEVGRRSPGNGEGSPISSAEDELRPHIEMNI